MKSPKRVEVDGIDFDPITQEAVVEQVRQRLHTSRGRQPKKSFYITKPYVEFFERAREDDKVSQAISEADLVVADSIAVQWASAWLREPKPSVGRFIWSLTVGLRQQEWLSQVIPERGEGASATHEILLAAAQHGWRVGILGGPRDTAATKAGLSERYPLLQLVEVWSGYFEPSKVASVTDKVKKANIDVLFVALGFPKQELFMHDHVGSGLAHVMLGEGGTFDYDEMGGPIRRAPMWLRRSGLEWLWRLVLQPGRIGRQLAIPRFMWRIFMTSRR